MLRRLRPPRRNRPPVHRRGAEAKGHARGEEPEGGCLSRQRFLRAFDLEDAAQQAPRKVADDVVQGGDAYLGPEVFVTYVAHGCCPDGLLAGRGCEFLDDHIRHADRAHTDLAARRDRRRRPLCPLGLAGDELAQDPLDVGRARHGAWARLQLDRDVGESQARDLQDAPSRPEVAPHPECGGDLGDGQRVLKDEAFCVVDLQVPHLQMARERVEPNPANTQD
mmetsp:Transcript_173284/g.555775  ORF Transcript_173284/g.555775 Transcript_173284/m.555775 type:complete len:222 (-) Transcript_173284:901-1566(-)